MSQQGHSFACCSDLHNNDAVDFMASSLTMVITGEVKHWNSALSSQQLIDIVEKALDRNAKLIFIVTNNISRNQRLFREYLTDLGIGLISLSPGHNSQHLRVSTLSSSERGLFVLLILFKNFK